MAANVNRPTNTAQKEKDINQKLQLYGIYAAFANGKVPSNKQIDVAMNSALSSQALASPSTKLSEEGRHLVKDLKEVITQAKYLLLSKNEGNLLQEFIWETQHLDGGNAKLPGAPTDKATAKQHGNEALDGLRTLGTLIISNGQFRKLLNDATILMRDMAGDAAQKAANKVNPNEDQLRQIDEPAEDNTWHEAPDMANLKSRAKEQYSKNKPFSRGDVQEAAQQAQNDTQNHPSDDNREAGRAGLSNAADNLTNKAQDNVPDENQDRAQRAKDQAIETKNNARHRTKNYIGDKIPQERRDQTIWRLKKMIIEIQGHSDYQQAIETLLNLAETYGSHANTMTKDGAGTVQGAHDDDSLRTAEANLKTLVERFANSTSTDDFFESLNNIYRDANNDPELKGWFKDVDKYIRRCLQEQGYIMRDEATNEWNALYDRGQFLLRDRYRDHTDRVLDETKFLADQFDQDPQNKAFANSLQKLFQDLGQGADGKPKFKPHLIKDLTNVIIPGIFENTRYVPIPRIEVSDPMIDAIVENLVIESDNLFPNVLEFGNDNYYRLGRRQNSSKNENKVMIAASGIQMDLRDVSYYVKKKQGFPSITDTGLMDIIMAGEGFSFKLAARTASKSDRTHFVTVENVTVSVKNLNIKLKKSNHKLLFAIAKPLLLKVMKPVITKAIEKQIRDNFVKADAYAWSIYQDVQKQAQIAKDNPDQAQNIYQSYVSAVQKKMTEKKEQAKEKVANAPKVNVAVTQQDSMFKNISLPGGISTKATEFKELAAKGNKWESPVFGIGSARESSDIPKLAPVTRKPHNAASGTVRSGNHPGREGTAGLENLGQDNYNSNAYSTNTNIGAYSDNNASYASSSGAYSGSTGINGNGAGFSNQVDQAFNKNTPAIANGPISTNGVTGMKGVTGTTSTTEGASYYDQVSTAR